MPPQQWSLHEEEPTSTSPEDEPRPSCTIVDPDFPELTVPHIAVTPEYVENSGGTLGFSSTGVKFVTVKVDSHIACRACAVLMPLPCHAVPLRD
jgi:hypothetical protein